MKLSKIFLKNFLFSEMPLPDAAILVYEQEAENSPNTQDPNFDLYVISFICINFEAFTTFSRIFTSISCTILRMSETVT